jgi:iron complex outermembrane receptor protein
VLDATQASVDLTGSSTTDGGDNYSAKGMLNLPLQSDTLGLRLVGSTESYGGWVDNIATGKKDQNERDIDSFRGKLKWLPTENMDVVLSAWHTKEEALGDSDSLENRTTVTPADDAIMEYDLYSATVRYDFGPISLLSATSVMDYANVLTSEYAGLPYITDENQDLVSEELRLTSNASGMFRWTAGVFYRQIERRTYLSLEAINLTQDQTQKSKSYAVFGEGTLSFLDNTLDVTLGARYFEDDRSFTEVVDPASLALVQTIDPSFSGTSKPTFDSFTPRLNVAWRPTDQWMIYGNVAKGFRTGQAQPTISLLLGILQGVEVPTSVEPEELWSYEIGTKGTFANGRASLEGAVYYNDWKDLQTLVVLSATPRVAGLINGGTARTSGVEVMLTVRPLDRLTLQAGGGYVDAKYTQDIAGTPVRDGDRIVGVPEVTASASATYRWPLTNSLGGFAYGGAQYTSDRTDVASSALPSDSTTTLGLRLGVEGQAWSAYLFGDNLTDEDGAVDVRLQGIDGPATRLRARTFGVNVRYNFN